nr:muscle M-line assembly protein unc-89-like [Lytechinus pictus]
MAAPTEAAAPKPSAPPPPAVTSGPVFTKTLSDVTVKEGKPVKLECAVKGQPQPDVKWYREGALLTPSPDFEVKYQNGVSTLTILEIFYDDAGQYACAATNSKGTKSTSCNVRVLPGTPPPSAQQAQQPPAQVNAVNDTTPAEKVPIGPPEFSKPLLPARYSEGGRCRFACTVKGNPAPKITWLRQGQPVDSGYRFVIKYDEKTGSATLDITMMLPEDKGEYTCIAKSKAGQVYLTAPLLLPAQYDHWAQEYEEQKAIEKAKKKKDVVNKELETKVNEKGGKITPSQATYQDADQDAPQRRPSLSPFQQRLQQEVEYRERIGRTSIYHAPMEWKTSKLSPFERRLLREVEIREMDSGPRGGPFSDQDSKASSFESRLEKEIKFRERKSSQDYDATDAVCRGFELHKGGPFDVAAFEASLLNQKQPQESESMEAETETELESELETSEASQQRAPRFLKELKNFRVSEGGKIALSCRVEGRPKPSIQWFKDGYPVPKSIRYDVSYMEGFSQFRIDPILPEDKGAYTVFAWNQFGKAVNTGRIKVDRHLSDEVSHMKGALGARVSMETEEYHLPDRERQPGEVREKHYKPTFKVIPSDLEVKEGKLARFNCRVRGRPPPDLVWYRNEMPVYPDANHRVIVNEGGEHALMISHARPQDSGMYTCIASNRAGEAKFHVKLNVDPKRQLVAPSFIDRIENATVRENEAVTLTCKVTGCPTPHVSWQRDQKHIMPNVGGYRMQMSEDGVCQLFIERVTRHDSAWYTCTAHNSAGRVSCRSRVQVIYDKFIKDNEPAPIFQRRPTQSKKPPPPPEQEEIPSYVTQYDGTPETDKKSSVKPEFVVPLNDNMKKKEGSSAHFACRLQPAGDPTMRIEWFKNNTPLFIGSRVQTKYEFGICSLDIKGVYPEDAGTITCRATNKYGQTETTGKLTCEAEQSLILDTQLPEEMRGIEKTIKFDEYLSAGDFPDDSKFPSEEFCRPELVTVPEPVSILEGENARFSCRISGVPAPRVSWFREDLQIIGQGARMRSWFDGIHYMEITKARVGDSGVVRLVARNKLGMVEFKTKLEVKPKDVPPPLLKPTPKEEKVPQPKPKIPGLQKTQAAKLHEKPNELEEVFRRRSQHAAPFLLSRNQAGTPRRVSAGPALAVKLKPVPKSSSFDMAKETNTNRLPFRDSLRSTPSKKTDMNLDDSAKRYPSFVERTLANDEDITPVVVERKGLDGIKLLEDEQVEAEVVSIERSAPMNLDMLTDADNKVPVDESVTSESVHSEESSVTYLYQKLGGQESKLSVEENITAEVLSDGEYEELSFPDRLEHMHSDGTTDDYTMPTSSISDSTQAQEEPQKSSRSAMYFQPVYRQTKNGGIYSDSETSTPVSSEDYLPALEIEALEEEIQPRQQNQPDPYSQHDGDYLIPISREEVIPFREQAVFSRPKQRDIFENDSDIKTASSSDDEDGSEGDGRSTPVNSDLSTNLKGIPQEADDSQTSDHFTSSFSVPITLDDGTDKVGSSKPYIVQLMLEKPPIEIDTFDRALPVSGRSGKSEDSDTFKDLSSHTSSSSSSDSEDNVQPIHKDYAPGRKKNEQPYAVEDMLEKSPINDDKVDKALPFGSSSLAQGQHGGDEPSCSSSSSSRSSSDSEELEDLTTKVPNWNKSEPFIVEVMLEKPPIQDDQFDRALPVQPGTLTQIKHKQRKSSNSSSSFSSDSEESYKEPVTKGAEGDKVEPYIAEVMLEKPPIQDDKFDRALPVQPGTLTQIQQHEKRKSSNSSSSFSSESEESNEEPVTKGAEGNKVEPYIAEVMLEKPPIQDDKFDRALPVQPGTLTQIQQHEKRKSSNSSSSFSSESEESNEEPVTKGAEGNKVEPYIAEVMLEKPPIQDDKYDRSLPISRDPFHRKPSDKRSSPTSSSSSHFSSSDSGESEPESDRHSYSSAIVFQSRQSKEEPPYVREDNSSADHLSSSRSSSSPHSSDGDVTKVSPLRRDNQHYTPLEISINTQLSAGNQKERTPSSSSSEYEHEALETKLMSRKLKSNLQGTKVERKLQRTSSSSSSLSSSSSTSSDEETQVSKARLMLHQNQDNQETIPQRTVASPSEDPSFEVLEIAPREGIEEEVKEESILPVEALPQPQLDHSVEDDDAVGFDITIDFKPNEEEQKPKWKSFFDDDEEETFPRLVGSPFGKNSVIFAKARSSQYDPIKPSIETETMAQRKELNESSTEDGGEEEVKEVNENRVLAKRISMTQMRALNPTGSPIIKQRLQDIKCKQGETITFHIDFTGIAPFEVTWYQDGYELEDSDEYGILVSDDYSSLMVPNTTPDDNSMIEVQVKNDLGVAASTAMLTVEEYQQPMQPTLTMQPAQAAAAAQPMEQMQLAPCFLSAPPPMTVGAPGEPVRLSCRVGGNPVPKVIWSKDGRLLTSVPRMKILQDEDIHTMLILECLPEDAGNYTIEIVGPSGKKTNCFRIQIKGDKPDDFEPHYPEVPHHHPEVQPIGFATLPEFRSVLTDCIVPDGSPVELACEVIGTPPPVINWYHNGGIIKPSRYFRMSYDDGIARLQINEVFQEDGGEYVCEAFNNAGRISCSGILNVQGKRP